MTVPGATPETGRGRALALVVGVPLVLLVVVLVAGLLAPGPDGAASGSGPAGPGSVGVAGDAASGAAGGSASGLPPVAGAPTGPAAGASDGPPTVPPAYDDATWCSPERGDCVHVDLPRVAGFGGASIVTRLPRAVDTEGCARALAADFWLWHCPAGAVVDTAAFGEVDVQDSDRERIYVKFKNLEAWRYLRAD